MQITEPAREELPESERPPSVSVLVVDDEPGIRNFLKKALTPHCDLLEVAESAERAEAVFSRCHFDLIIMDIRLPGRSGIEWAEELRGQGTSTEVILMTGDGNLDAAIAALRAGAADFIQKPFRIEQIISAVNRWQERRKLTRENFILRRELDQFVVEGMVGASAAIKQVCAILKRVAPTPATLLIQGESGTGKELAARSLHRFSGRKGAFVPINCGSISAELLESELFGHVKGAFTGAHQARQGLFSYAHEGTLFLDEIGEMPLSMQAKLLRVLEERTIRPVGSEQELPVDVRIVAATNRNLAEEVRTGNFREDLFYRLNVIAVTMPSLSERKEDIPALAVHFADKAASQIGTARVTFRETELRALQDYHWPGNIRELKNVIERSLLLGKPPHACITCGATGGGSTEPDRDGAMGGTGGGYPLSWPLDRVERSHMERVLAAAGGNKSEAARRLGVSRKTLERKFNSRGD